MVAAAVKRAVLFALLPLLVLSICLQIVAPAPTEEVSRQAADLFTLGRHITVTNSMVAGWLLAVFAVVAVRLAVGRHPSAIPSRGQAAVELLMEKLQDLFRPIVGSRILPHIFPFLLTLFLYLLVTNLSGLIPGVGAIGWGRDGHFLPLLRPPNGDLNGTFALALISFGAWLYFVFRYAGPRAFLQDTFGNKADRQSVPFSIYLFLGSIFLAVGAVDVISILFRVVSLSFRLYGNVFGGENLISRMTGLYGYLMPVPFYFLELLIGIIQALVFTLLTAVYVGLLTGHGEDEEQLGGSACPDPIGKILDDRPGAVGHGPEGLISDEHRQGRALAK
jgi:F-type H+-transporting ATPase subunit a